MLAHSLCTHVTVDGVKWNVRVFAEGWMEWNEMDMDPYVGPYVDLRVMDWNPGEDTGSEDTGSAGHKFGVFFRVFFRVFRVSS